jgi:hypothetical protein
LSLIRPNLGGNETDLLFEFLLALLRDGEPRGLALTAGFLLENE